MREACPLISIIVPVYKVERYLEKCVKSIQNQTYSNLEIILVDDGSPDNCGKMCDELAENDSRIRTVHRENGGQSAARNSGLSVAAGDYIGFVDSDDYIDKDMFECLYDAMASQEADLAVCNARSVSESGRVVKKHEGNGKTECFIGKDAYDRIIPTLNNSVWNKLFKKEVIGKTLFPVGQIHGEDFIFLLEYLKKVRKVARVNADKYNYLQREGSITGGVFSEKKLDEISSKDTIYEIIKENFPDYEAIAKKWCFTARMNVVRGIIKNKAEKKFSEELEENRKYILKNFNGIRQKLRCKEKVEYRLYAACPFLYKILIQKLK